MVKAGYSQEELSEKTGLSLRTIQRIENGETEPRGDSLKRLASVFDISPDEIVDWAIQENKGFLISLNLSALAYMVLPILGIVVPLIIWISKKDKIKKLNDLAKDLLNFQLTWTITLFIGTMFFIGRSVYTIKIMGDISPAMITSMSFSILLLFVIMYLFNLVLIIVNTIRINHDKSVVYYPKISFLRK